MCCPRSILKMGKIRDGQSFFILGCGSEKKKTNRTISQLIPSNVSLRVCGAQHLKWVKRMVRGIGNVPCSTFSPTENESDPVVTFGEPLKHMLTLIGQILVSRTDADIPAPPPRVSIQDASVCPFNTSSVYAGTTRTCFYTCARGAGSHGDVLNVHTEASWMDTGVFQRVTPQHHNTSTTTTQDTAHKTQHDHAPAQRTHNTTQHHRAHTLHT